MQRGRTVRGAMVAVVGLMVAATLSACHVNAGSDASEAFVTAMQAEPGVQKVTGGGNNNLPFSGTADGAVVLEPATSTKRTHELVDIIGEYQSKHSGSLLMWDDVSIAVDGFQMQVTRSRADNAHELAVFDTLRGDSSLGGARLAIADNRMSWANGRSVELVGAAGVSVFDTFDTATALVAKPGMFHQAPVTAFDAAKKNTITTISENSSVTPTVAIAAYRAVGERFAITGAQLDPRSAQLHIENAADVGAASSLVSAVASASSIHVSITGGILSRDDAPASPADTLADAVSSMSGITAISVKAGVLVVDVDGTATAGEVAAKLATEPERPQVQTVTIRSDGWGEPGTSRGFFVNTDGGQLGDAMALLTATADFLPVNIKAHETWDVLFDDASASADGLGALFAAAKPHLPEGSRVSVRHGSAGGEYLRADFTVAAHISIAAERAESAPQKAFRRDVVAAWNAAPSGR